MKKILTLSVLSFLFSVSFLHAQILKKDVLLGASLGFGTNNASNSPSNSNANISPRIGYAIGNNSVLYANLGYSFNKSESDIYNNASRSSSFSAGISWKKFIPVKERFGMFTSLYGSYARGNYKQEIGTPPVLQKSTTNSYTGGLIPGVYYLPVPWLVLNVDAGGITYNYNKSKNEGNPAGHSSNFNVSFLNYFTFGVDFILQKKKK